MQEFEDTKDEIKGDRSKIAVLFSEMSQMCLWYVLDYLGNIGSYLTCITYIIRGNATVRYATFIDINKTNREFRISHSLRILRTKIF